MRSVILLFALLVTGCASSQNAEREPVLKDLAGPSPTPISSPSPLSLPHLSKTESEVLDAKLPPKTRQIFDDAKEIELFDATFCSGLLFPKLTPIEKDKFLGCGYSKKVVVSDEGAKKQLLDGLFYGASTSDMGAACFAPKYGIRAVSKNQRVEIIICFHCGNFRGVSTAGKVGGGISNAPLPILEKLFGEPSE